MTFVYRAAIVAVATFVSALAGFGTHWVLPAAYVVEPKGMVGYVVGLVASLLSLVLSLLIWTSHGLCTAQQSQLQTIVSSIIRLDFVLKAYGPEAEPGRALLREHVKRIRARLWSNLNERGFIYRAEVPEDVDRMIAFFVSLRPANDEQRQYLASARDIFGGVGAQPEIGGQRWPSRRFQASLRETGMPRAVMRLSTLQPTLASTFCAGRVRARSVRPMMVL